MNGNLLVFFSHGEKGGVGKTAVASAAIDLLLASGRRVAVIEGDTDNADIAQRYSGAANVLKKVRLSDPSEYQRAVNDLVTFLAECMESGEIDAVVVNMPAGAYTTIDRDIDVLADAFINLDLDISVAISTGNTDHSITRTVKIATEGIGKLGKKLILAPEFLKDESLVEKIESQGHGLSASIYPRLSSDTMQVILGHPTSTLKELTLPDGPIKSPIQRIRIAGYLRQAKAVLEPLMGGLVDADAFCKSKT